MNFNIGFNTPLGQVNFSNTTQATYIGSVSAPSIISQEQFITSQNGQYHLKLETNGNLSLYTSQDWNPSNCIWSSNTQGKGIAPFQLNLNGDGSLIIKDQKNSTIWTSNTIGKGNAPYYLAVQDDRNVVYYDRNNCPVWATNTYINPSAQQQQQFHQPPGYTQQSHQFSQNQQPQQGFNQPPGFTPPPQALNQPPQAFNQPPVNPMQQQQQQQHQFNQAPSQQFNQPPGQQQPQFNQPPPQQFNAPPQAFNQPPGQQSKNVKLAQGNQNPWINEKLPMMMKRTKQIGNVQPNSQCFDDFFGLQLNKEFHTPELSEITVYYTNQYVVGIESKFKCMGKNQDISGVENRNMQNQSGVMSQTIKLGFAERIDSIAGRAGQWIDRITIKTSKKQTIDVGGNGGQPFDNILPFGIHTGVAFGGSYSQYLDSLYLLHK